MDSEQNKNSNFCVTWASSQFLMNEKITESFPFSYNTLSQIVKVSIGGDNIRIKFSNKYGNDKLEILSARISNSLSQGTGEIDSSSTTKVLFNNKENITIPLGEEIYSDIFSYNLIPLSEVSITINLGNAPTNYTGHVLSNTNSFIYKGNANDNENNNLIQKVPHWFFISLIEVLSSSSSDKSKQKGLVCFGDSITDGKGSTLDKQLRWPDYLSEKLHKNSITNIGIINQGISGSLLTKEGLQRFENDVLEMKGVAKIFILYGINDINKINAKEDDIINGYKQLIKKAHENGLLIFGGTLLPEKGYRLYTEEKNEIRKKINEWMKKNSGKEEGFDKVFDFDSIIKDPVDEDKIKDEYNSGDGIHPNSNGYKKISELFDKELDLFKEDF